MSKKNRNYNDTKNDTVVSETAVNTVEDSVDVVPAVEEDVPVTEDTVDVTEVVDEVPAVEEDVPVVEESVTEDAVATSDSAEIVHADLTEAVPAKDIEEAKVAPVPEMKASAATTISGITKGYGAGQKINLNGARVYASATSDTIKRIARGAYYVYSGTVSNDRLQICIKNSSDPKNIIGWVNVKNIL